MPMWTVWSHSTLCIVFFFSNRAESFAVHKCDYLWPEGGGTSFDSLVPTESHLQKWINTFICAEQSMTQKLCIFLVSQKWVRWKMILGVECLLVLSWEVYHLDRSHCWWELQPWLEAPVSQLWLLVYYLSTVLYYFKALFSFQQTILQQIKFKS